MSQRANIAVVYYSSTGHMHELAEAISAGAAEAGANVRVRRAAETVPTEDIVVHHTWMGNISQTKHIPTAAAADLLWADGIIFGTPARFGNVAAQLKAFIDTLSGLWRRDLLSDKVYSGFTSTASMHGGQESTLLALYNSVHHFGGILVTPGYKGDVDAATRNPYGATHFTRSDGSRPVDDAARNAARLQGRRVAVMATAFKLGLSRPSGGGAPS